MRWVFFCDEGTLGLSQTMQFWERWRMGRSLWTEFIANEPLANEELLGSLNACYTNDLFSFLYLVLAETSEIVWKMSTVF